MPPRKEPRARRPSETSGRHAQVSLVLATSLLVFAAGVAFANATAQAPEAPAAGQAAPHPNNASQVPGLSEHTGRVLVPVLDIVSQRTSCDSWIAVQNIGKEATKAVLVVWAEPEPECRGPLKTECTGLIKPGATWNLLGYQIPSGAMSGVLFSFTTRRLSEIGIDRGSDDVVADFMCEKLLFGTVGECDVYAEFSAAYESGGVVFGVPMDQAIGSPLAVQVRRGCPGDVVPGVWVTSAYNGVGANRLGEPDASIGGYRYQAAPVLSDNLGWNSVLYIQNGGSADATTEVWFQPEDTCEGGLRCRVLTVRPGESAAVDATDCVGPGWTGSARIESDQPLGVIVDTMGHDTLMTHGAAAHTAPGQAPNHADPVALGHTLSGPLVFDGQRGWDTAITVQNLSLTDEAQLEVVVLDTAGNTVETMAATICAGGANTFRMPMEDTRRGGRPGSIRVTSLSDAPAAAAPIGAVVSLTHYRDAERSAVTEAMAYDLVSQQTGISQPSGGESTGADTGTAVIALPGFHKDLDHVETGVTTEYAIANMVDVPGWTDVAILVYDQNDLVDVFCRRLAAREVEYVDLQVLGAVNPGFNGSAIVSATYWEHYTAPDDGSPARNLVHLAAASVWRFATMAGQDIPGDEAALALGTPLQGLPSPLVQDASAACVSQAVARPTATPRPPSERDAALAGQVHLPVLRFQGNDEECSATVIVRNTGTEPAKAILIAWGEPGFCAPQCAGPFDVTCSGLIAPGESWTFDETAISAGYDSAILYSINTRTLAEFEAGPGTDELAADFLCDRINQDVLADCDSWRRFELAYNGGLRFWDVPLDLAVGPPLETTVERSCPDVQTPGTSNTSRYAGLGGTYFDAFDEIGGGYWQTVSPVFATKRHLGTCCFNTVLYVQNAGTECTSVDLWFQHSGDCLRYRQCTIVNLAPGEQHLIDTSECVGPDWVGTVVLHSEEPLAVVADTYAPEVQWSHVGFPGRSAYDLNSDGRVDRDDVSVMVAALESSPGDPNWNPRADLNGDAVVDVRDREWLRRNLCGAGEPENPEPTRGEPRRADQVHLPTLDFLGTDDVCRSWIAVQNIGDEAAGAVMVVWGSPSAEGEPCSGPLTVRCTGLIGPGKSWHFLPEQMPKGARSAAVFSFTTRDLAEIDICYGGSVTNLMCETLLFGVVGDCEDYRRFKRAFDNGGDFAGIPMVEAVGSPLAVQVERSCPADRTPTLDVTAAYAGIGANEFGRFDAVRERYTYYAPLVYGDKAGFNSVMYIQNAGGEPATVELHFRGQDDCSASLACDPLTIQAGESATFDPTVGPCGAGWVSPDWQGSAWLESSQPLAVIVEVSGRDTLSSYKAVPAHSDYEAGGEALPDISRYVAYGPLIFHPEDGWDVGVQVQNLHGSAPAHVRVEFRDEAGGPIQILDDVICANGSQTYFAPVTEDRGGHGAGTVRVVSQRPERGPLNQPAPISAIALMLQYSDAARSEAEEAIAYNLLSEAQAFDWPTGSGGGSTESGIGVLAVPGLVRNARESGVASELVVANLVAVPGWTDVAVWIYDRNALVDIACRRLTASEVEYIDLRQSPQLTTGFMGSAIVSALAWEHPVSGGGAGQGRNLLGIGAAVVSRRGAGIGLEAPGDEVGVALAVPLRHLPESVARPAGDPCEAPRRWRIYLPALPSR